MTVRCAVGDMVVGVSGDPMTCRDGTWYVHHGFGRILERLAPRVREVRCHVGRATHHAAACDFPLTAPNFSVFTWGDWRNSLHALKRPDRLLRNYRNMVRGCDGLFLRGSSPLIWTAHLMARMQSKPVVHWVTSNPLAIMRGEDRGYGTALAKLGVAYALIERTLTQLAMRISRATVLANGAELAGIFRTPRTVTVVSTSITEDDFLLRDDTCTQENVRVLFVGFIRAEKGIEYLLRALPLIRSKKPVKVALVGSAKQFPEEHQRLSKLLSELGIEKLVSWEGYARHGAELFEQMDRSDLLVLPTLSEGTPRVLVEARARSLPVVSTTVGGIPSSVTDGEDGLLVAPRDPAALAEAITRIIGDGVLRRRLIERGRERVRDLTIDRFVDLVVKGLSCPG